MNAEAWIPDLTRSTGAKYQAIADALHDAVARGALRPGDRLPPQRELAARLGIDLTTVTKAYDVARQRGLIEARGRAGSFVLPPRTALLPPPDPVDTGMNTPPELPGGMLARAIGAALPALLAPGGNVRLQYQPAGGAPQDRAAGVALLAGLGLAATEEQLVVAAGGQNALQAIVGAALRPGDAVACGRFTYPGLKALAELHGLRLLALPEMTADALDALCCRESVRALYLVPTNDNPTTETLLPEARAAIAECARRHDLVLIEDDAYGLLAAERIAPVARFAPERSWYVASMSKILSPALRVAFVRAPSVGDALRLTAGVHASAVMAPPLNVAMVSLWLADGSFGRLVGAMRGEAAARQALAAAVLVEVPWHAHPQGYHLWLPLAEATSASDLAAAMRGSGLSVVPSDRFAVAPDAGQAVRVSLGGLLDRERLERALRLLHGHISAQGMQHGLVV
jgi:DNA-binding transcriptional MocR family regulator